MDNKLFKTYIFVGCIIRYYMKKKCINNTILPVTTTIVTILSIKTFYLVTCKDVIISIRLISQLVKTVLLTKKW